MIIKNQYRDGFSSDWEETYITFEESVEGHSGQVNIDYWDDGDIFITIQSEGQGVGINVGVEGAKTIAEALTRGLARWHEKDQ